MKPGKLKQLIIIVKWDHLFR